MILQKFFEKNAKNLLTIQDSSAIIINVAAAKAKRQRQKQPLVMAR